MRYRDEFNRLLDNQAITVGYIDSVIETIKTESEWYLLVELMTEIDRLTSVLLCKMSHMAKLNANAGGEV